MAAARGFTLIELLVVLVIVGITLGVAAFNAMPSERQALQNEAQRIALLLQLARDEAIVRNRPIAFEAETERYRFLVRDLENGAMADQFRALGCTRLCIAFRNGPYDWEALEAFAAEIVSSG